jgi:putative ABC transport system ATP-binding protein
MNKEFILGHNLTKTYHRGSETVYALKDASLTVAEGEMLAIVGPSGSGKTTLLNLLGCLDTPTSGSLTVNGADISNLREADLVKVRRENIGFVFQQFFLLPTLTVEENIALPYLFARNGNHHNEKTNEVINMVGLSTRAKHLPHQLSGGEMQRVAVGRALANAPRILLADEPTGNLDSTTADKIFELFRDLNSRGLTLIIVTHNMELAKKAHRLISLRDGHIV